MKIIDNIINIGGYMKKKLLTGLFAIIMCFALVGCGKEEQKNQPENNNEQPKQEENNKDSVDLYSDDTRIVFSTDQGLIIFYYEGNKITGYHVYFDYEDNETATYALSTLEKDEEVEKMYVRDKYLVFEYKESAYEYLTLEDVKKSYSYLEEVKKNS